MSQVEKKINELRPGDVVQAFYLIKQSEMKQTTTNNKYMNFIFADSSGEVNAKLWDWDEQNVARYPASIIVKVRAQVLDWQGQLQLKIEKIKEATEDDNVDIMDFVPSAPETSEKMFFYIENCLENMKNKDLKKLTASILGGYREQLMYFPAAKKNHHAVRGGLLYHITSMLKAAEALCGVYTYLNQDLLYTGVILHDIGKIVEMDSSKLGIVSEYTTEGILLGHLIQGIKIIESVASEIGMEPELKMMLEHMILSHHYQPEYGSPKYPMFPEAEMLHYLDIMDARLYDMKKVLDTTERGAFSEKLWSLDNRSIYKPLY